MNLWKQKKGAGPAIIILLVILAAIVIYWVSGLVQRECDKDTDCGEGFYCGSDFQCHEHKIIEKTEIRNFNLLIPSIIVGIAIVVAAIILRSKKLEKLLGV
ncbi:hypothetical protein HYS48_03790 [Candidatus Woesearchaeota archaeon]|nr:hypothetical protein [Candidatus Woesearchaeota archaeon]